PAPEVLPTGRQAPAPGWGCGLRPPSSICCCLTTRCAGQPWPRAGLTGPGPEFSGRTTPTAAPSATFAGCSCRWPACSCLLAIRGCYCDLYADAGPWGQRNRKVCPAADLGPGTGWALCAL